MFLGDLILPTVIDKTPNDKISFRSPKPGEESYIQNIECFLRLEFCGNSISVDYYCEDDTYLSELFNETHKKYFEYESTQGNFLTFQESLLDILLSKI